MSCCPKSAWGELKNPDYKEKGIVEKVRLVKEANENLSDDELHSIFKILQKQAFALNGKNLSFSRNLGFYLHKKKFTDLVLRSVIWIFIPLGKVLNASFGIMTFLVSIVDDLVNYVT